MEVLQCESLKKLVLGVVDPYAVVVFEGFAGRTPMQVCIIVTASPPHLPASTAFHDLRRPLSRCAFRGLC